VTIKKFASSQKTTRYSPAKIIGTKKKQTPAMASGLAGKAWTIRELLEKAAGKTF